MYNKRRDRGPQNITSNKKYQGKGSISNTTGRKTYFLNGLEKNYCSVFLDVGEVCKHGDKCHFVHAVFPNSFTDSDKITM